MDDKLYAVIDYILNRADDREIEVILKAVKKRYAQGGGGGRGGLNPQRMATQMARQISQQVGMSQEQIRHTVRNMSADIIRKNAPELTEQQVNELLKAWVPNPEDAKPRYAPVPRDALMMMVDQFLRYSAGSMSATEQMNLEHDIPGWTEKYWSRFPKELRDVLTLYLKGAIGDDDFQEALNACLQEAPE